MCVCVCVCALSGGMQKANPFMPWQGEFKHSWGTAEKLYKSEAVSFSLGEAARPVVQFVFFAG